MEAHTTNLQFWFQTSFVNSKQFNSRTLLLPHIGISTRLLHVLLVVSCRNKQTKNEVHTASKQIKKKTLYVLFH